MSELPEVAFFRQEPQGMQRIAAGHLKRNGNGFGCRIETRLDNMMNSGYSFADLDGLIILVNHFLYFATTWKDVTVHLGYEKALEEDPVKAADTEMQDTDQQTMALQEPEKTDRSEQRRVDGTDGERGNEAEKEGRLYAGEKAETDREGIEMASFSMEEKEETPSDIRTEPVTESVESPPREGRQTDTIAACQCEACCRCPQRRRMDDFGRHMLAIFPRMDPFEIESIEECVRLELKDIGCLPVRYWSLSGNPFLLHGYYCYRHILFTKTSDGGYYIGVPGIYNKESEKKARSCGFGEFRTLSEVADRLGAFGYWLFDVSDS